jgi:hypothetical protein
MKDDVEEQKARARRVYREGFNAGISPDEQTARAEKVVGEACRDALKTDQEPND